MLYLNEHTRKSVLTTIEERNGWEQCKHDDQCVYLHPETGRTCLAGAFIPEESHMPTLEGFPVAGLPDWCAAYWPLAPVGMAELQSLHDYPLPYRPYNRQNVRRALMRMEARARRLARQGEN